jgi:hypothetical protein
MAAISLIKTSRAVVRAGDHNEELRRTVFSLLKKADELGIEIPRRRRAGNKLSILGMI